MFFLPETGTGGGGLSVHWEGGKPKSADNSAARAFTGGKTVAKPSIPWGCALTGAGACSEKER